MFLGKVSRTKVRTAFKNGAYEKYEIFHLRYGCELSGNAARYIDNRQGDKASTGGLYRNCQLNPTCKPVASLNPSSAERYEPAVN